MGTLQNRLFILQIKFIFISFNLLMFVLPKNLFTQNVGIGDTSDFTPASSSILELRSTLRGLLLPRMSHADRIAITSPAPGLMVIQTNDSLGDPHGIWYYCPSDHVWEMINQTSGGGGSVSVGLSLPSEFTVTGSPVTGTGTLTGNWANQNANLIFAGPASGSAARPAFRALSVNDIPAGTYNISITGTAANLAGGSAGSIPYQSSANNTAMLAAGTAGQVLTSNGTAPPSWTNPIMIKYRTTDSSVKTNTTLFNDNTLFLTFGANQVWQIDGLLIDVCDNQNPDFKFAFTVPADASMYISWQAIDADFPTQIKTGELISSGVSSGGINSGSTANPIIIKGIVTTISSGNFQLKWAQFSNNGNNTTLKANSYLKATRVK
jgi:hypothetical protein